MSMQLAAPIDGDVLDYDGTLGEISDCYIAVLAARSLRSGLDLNRQSTDDGTRLVIKA